MARKRSAGEVSQADAVREGWKSLGPGARGVDVIAYVDEHYPAIGLGKKSGGSAVVSGLRSQVFGKKRGRKRRGRASGGGKRIVKRVRKPAAAFDLPLLIEAKEFVVRCGSAETAIAAIDQLRKLQVVPK